MKQYALQSKVTYVLFVFVAPCFMIVIGTLWIYIAVTRPGQNAPVWFGILWLVGVLFSAYQSLKMPYRIEMMDSGQINFVGILATTVSTQDVISVKQRAFSGGFLELKHTRGKIRLLQQFTGFHEFLTELKRVNPSVEITGC